MQKINVTVQYFHGCPHSDDMLSNVRQAIAPLSDSVDFVAELIDTDEKAIAIKFRGSPTLLINGCDYEDMAEPDSAALTCRFYKSGLPSVDEIRQRIQVVLDFSASHEVLKN